MDGKVLVRSLDLVLLSVFLTSPKSIASISCTMEFLLSRFPPISLFSRKMVRSNSACKGSPVSLACRVQKSWM